ncbi:MAG: urease accessory protein UreD [Gammaproteobacteria bacterium]|nr:urease accessory protein UreD [Gammaproteobacteria bacterium]
MMQAERETLATAPPSPRSWKAQLDLGFNVRHQKTALTSRKHTGPLSIQKTFYPEENGTCHTYILHPPGGLVGGDEITINIAAEEDTQALLTTPSAGKFYRSHQLTATQKLTFTLKKNACVEWLPQETILFDKSTARLTTDVHLAEGAHYIGWDILCFGRPASFEQFNEGHCQQNTRIYRNQKPLLIENTFYAGGTTFMRAPWGLNNFIVSATLQATVKNAKTLSACQAITKKFTAGQAGVTLIEDLIICRIMAHDKTHVWNLLIELWHRLRPDTLGHNPHLPRIWAT